MFKNIKKQSSAGLDISDYSIEIFQLDPQAKLKAFGRIILEQGIIKDGVILNQRELVNKIRQILSKGKFKIGHVVLSLPDVHTFAQIFHVSKYLEGKALQDAIAIESSKTIPADQTKLYWDYQIIPDSLDTSKQSVLYIGASKKIVNGYIKILNKLRLKPIAFEMESIAIGRALLKEIKNRATVMIIDIGARTTNISIFNRNGVIELSSVLPIAGNSLTNDIAKELNVSQDKAETLKRNNGLSKDDKISSVLKKQLQPLIDEIKKTLRHYNEDVDKIFLAGGSALMPDITTYFSDHLNKKVFIGKSSIANQLKEKSILYNTVIGLALRTLEKNPGLSGLNLLPPKRRKKALLL